MLLLLNVWLVDIFVVPSEGFLYASHKDECCKMAQLIVSSSVLKTKLLASVVLSKQKVISIASRQKDKKDNKC